jgi:hypothetical protein
MTTRCVQCGKLFDDDELVSTPVGTKCEACNRVTETPPRLLTPSVVAGLIAGVVPFFAHYVQSQTRAVNGVEQIGYYYDYVGLVGGAITLICGVLSRRTARATPGRQSLRMLVGAALMALGAFHVFRGMGMLRALGIP